MKFEEALEIQTILQNELDAASDAMNRFPKGEMGITPDIVKFSPEFIAAKNRYNVAFRKLREFNAVFIKLFKKEYRAWCDARRVAKRYANNV